MLIKYADLNNTNCMCVKYSFCFHMYFFKWLEYALHYANNILKKNSKLVYINITMNE